MPTCGERGGSAKPVDAASVGSAARGRPIPSPAARPPTTSERRRTTVPCVIGSMLCGVTALFMCAPAMAPRSASIQLDRSHATVLRDGSHVQVAEQALAADLGAAPFEHDAALL